MPKVFVKDIDPRLQKQFQAASQSLKTNPGYAAELAAGLLQRVPECLEIRRLLRQSQKLVQGDESRGIGKLFGGLSGMTSGTKLAKTDPMLAMENAEKALAKKVSDISAHKLLAAAAETLGLHDTAALAYEEIALLEPKVITHQIAIAEAYLKDGDPTSALTNLDKAIKLFPGSGELLELARKASVAQTMDKGKWGEGGDFRSKIKDTEEAARLEQQSRIVNDVDAAAETIMRTREQLEVDPENINLCKEMVRQCLIIDDRESALAYLRYARQTPLGKSDASLEKQEAELVLEDLAAKVTEAETSLASDPANTGLRAALDSAKAALSDHRLEVYRGLVERYPNDHGYRFEYGVQLLASGNLDDAIRELQLAQRSPKHRQSAMLNIGKAFAAGRKYDLAAETLSIAKGEIAVLNDLKKEISYELGLALEKGGREKEAVDEYKSIYMVDAGYRDVSKKINDYYEKKH